MKNKNYLILESVGSIYDIDTCIIYPLQKNGKPDLNMGVYYGQASLEWFDRLSEDESHKIFELTYNK